MAELMRVHEHLEVEQVSSVTREHQRFSAIGARTRSPPVVESPGCREVNHVNTPHRESSDMQGDTRANSRVSRKLMLAVVVLLAACRIPQDLEGTLDSVQQGYLDVGLTENPPWVIDTGEGPAGVEVEMVRQLAAELEAEVRWHWGTEGSLVSALQAYQLDMAVGGLEQAPWLSNVVAMSRVFFKDIEVVGFPPAREVPDSLEGVRVAVPSVDDLGGVLKKQGALPVHGETVASKHPVAGPLWWVRAKGYTPGPWRLGERRHVWLLPKGENAWILRVDRYLARYTDLAERLREAGAAP